MANINMRRIGRRLKKAREAKHLTQEEFAELLGLSVGYIGMIECGRRSNISGNDQRTGSNS